MKKYISALFSVIVLIALDQYTKYLAVLKLKDQDPFVIWDGVFELRYLENRGAAFGMLQNQQMFFIILTILVLVFIFYAYMKTPVTRRFLPMRLTIIFITAGALGNLIDRVKNGFVVDFFYFSLIDFPIFNVADIYVTVTFFVLAILLLVVYKDEELEIYSLKKDKV